ncbi:hypothetical protein [Desulfoscipio gibsoniae]|uniref:Uncharacterized protein n=1 Tax=Desulfoscipio gibsoniae DSM 7213 TaxID=767817 RepID=R4KQ95_9FIRM|nr:hypothetical protein [Desulfoscipio gibsoniae]AGL03707.1 hypothetical protein Desgi_4479 [Desulfoscipio gibsoniae DSM 7213]
MNLWEAFDKIDDHLKDKLLTIPPYPCVSGKKVEELLGCLENPDPAWGGLEGEVLRMVINPWQRAYQIEYRFKPSKILSRLTKVIESATYDLMIGNYICSYLTLVPAVEVALREWAIEHPEIKSANTKGEFSILVFGKYLVKYLGERNDERRSNPDFQNWIRNQIKYLEYMIKEVFYQNFAGSKKGVKREFNRNRALHFLEYMEEPDVLRDNNTRVLLLLDIIAELYLSLDTKLYTDNTFYANWQDNTDLNLRWKIYLKNKLEAIDFTDINIIRFAFITEDRKVRLTDEMKQHFIKQKDGQIHLITSRRKGGLKK